MQIQQAGLFMCVRQSKNGIYGHFTSCNAGCSIFLALLSTKLCLVKCYSFCKFCNTKERTYIKYTILPHSNPLPWRQAEGNIYILYKSIVRSNNDDNTNLEIPSFTRLTHTLSLSLSFYVFLFVSMSVFMSIDLSFFLFLCIYLSIVKKEISFNIFLFIYLSIYLSKR